MGENRVKYKEIIANFFSLCNSGEKKLQKKRKFAGWVR